VSIKGPSPAKLREAYGEDPERIFGQRLRVLREEAGMTQAQLAERMTGQGFPMHQTTIGKIEANQRPVRVNEASMLAGILGLQLSDLLADPDLTAEVAELREELEQALARRLKIEARRAELQATRAAAGAELSAANQDWIRAEEAEREARRRYRLARRRAAGHRTDDD
jgi:transcriptional regulator with XRE-family HTH domain